MAEGLSAETDLPLGDGERVIVLDQALWAALAAERPGAALATAWLTLQCRQLREITRGVLVRVMLETG